MKREQFKLIMKTLFTIIAIQLKTIDHEEADLAFRELMEVYKNLTND